MNVSKSVIFMCLFLRVYGMGNGVGLEIRAGGASGLWQKSPSSSKLVSQTLLKVLKGSYPPTDPKTFLFWIEKDWVTAYGLFICILVVLGREAAAFQQGVGVITGRVQAGKQAEVTGKTGSWAWWVNYCMQGERTQWVALPSEQLIEVNLCCFFLPVLSNRYILKAVQK